MIVKTTKLGDTTVYYHDDYCKDVTPEETKKILDEYARIALQALRAAQARKDKTG